MSLTGPTSPLYHTRRRCCRPAAAVQRVPGDSGALFPDLEDLGGRYLCASIFGGIGRGVGGD
ncbi:hypothetical protein BC936DRAFT_148701 [Jimgerdemannia flammicorona]|uniref:Uncharacterized protein n=1 Tax=Jimgerdemannia flammicorona TaxID=994334 RepID=A0A433D2H3_9FUNG|nr:hypothetical protein BC936DRAFT_148701 [Jimgerdemannia flammicorona]